MASEITAPSNSERESRSDELLTGRPAEPPSAESRAARMIREVFESGRPLTYVRSAEEQRIARVLAEVGIRLLASGPVPVWTWSLTEGMRRGSEPAEAGTETPRGVLDFIIAHQGAAIFHLKDFHEPLRESAEIRRRLRDLYESCLDRRKFVVITSPVRFIPEEVERSVMFLELRPPDLIELVEFLRDETREDPPRDESGEPNEAILYQFARTLQGLTLDEARYALRRAVAANRKSGTRFAAGLARGKAAPGESQRRSSSMWPTVPVSGKSVASKVLRNGCWSAASFSSCATA